MRLSAKKFGTMRAVKESLKKGGGGNQAWIKNVPAEGISVRFLTEPEEWFGYSEYYDESAKAFVPMAEGEVLPDGARPSFRYLANALDVESDRVIPLKLPKTAANALILKYDRFDTLLDRNYDLQRHGEGLDTSYDVTPDGPSKMNLAKYDLLDLEEVLLAARRQAVGDEGITASQPSAAVAEDDIDNDDDDDDSQELFPDGDLRLDYSSEELAKMTPEDLEMVADYWAVEPTAAAVMAAQSGGESEGEAEVEDEEEVEYSLEDLKGMGVRDLRLIALDLNVDPKGKTKNQLVDAIIEAAEA